MRTAWAVLISLISVAGAASAGADGVRFDAGLEASLGDGVGSGWTGELPGGGAIDGLSFSLESDGFAGDGLVIDDALATGGVVNVTVGGEDSVEGDRATVVPLPSGAAAAMAGLGCLGLRRSRRGV